MRWRVEDLAVFCAVVETCGVTAAAARQGMPKSTVSKALARLEDDLGLRLIERTSRRLRVTTEGAAFHARASVIVELAGAADAEVQGLRAGTPTGRVTLALPAAFCREIVAPRLMDFVIAWPGIELELVVPSRGSGLQSDDCDLAVVVGPQPDSALMQKVLLGGRVVWVSSPAYASEHGLRPAPCGHFKHVRICEARFLGNPPSIIINGHPAKLELPPNVMRVNDPLSVREAVRAGLGVSLLAERYCTSDLANGSLVEVWQEVQFEEGAGRLAVVFPSHRLLSPRFRAVITFLEAVCQDHARGVRTTSNGSPKR